MGIPKEKRKAPPAPNSAPPNWHQRLLAKQVLPNSAPHGAAAEPLDLPPLAPDYRFRTAASAAFEGRLLSRRRYDRATCELADYLAALIECVDAGERSAVDRRFGNVALAMAAHSGSNRELGFLIEAYTLARHTATDISARTGLAISVVQQFREYFCDYGALLKNRTYVVRHARIEQAIMSPDPLLQRKGVLLLIGYFCGGQALDLLVWTRATKGCESWTSLDVTFEQIQLFELTRRAVRAAFTGSALPLTAQEYAALAGELRPIIDKYGLSNTNTQSLFALGMP